MNVEAQELQGKVKKIDFSKNYLVCEKSFGDNDKPRKYYFHDTLSVERYEIFEDLEMLVAKGRSYADVYRSQKKIHELLNQSKVADAAIENWNSMELVKEKIEKRFHPAMRMVALFANKEDEDMTKYNDLVMEKKMADWKNEGYAMADFFSLAFSLVEDFLESYNEIFQGLLDKPELKRQSKGQGEKEKSGGAGSSQPSEETPAGDTRS